MDNAQLIEGLKKSVPEVMATMALSEVEFTGEESSNSFVFTNEVGGLVRLSGSVNGMVGIATNDAVVRKTVSKITGLAPEMLEKEDILDGISELANMVCGGMKTKANAGDIELSAPVAIIGGDFTALWKTDRPTRIFKYRLPEGDFFVHVCI